MANTVSLLSYANTFGEWVTTTNKVAQEVNDLAANNYVKGSGTLYLNDGTLGLQIANNAVIGGQLQSQGIGSSAYIQNNLRVDSQTYMTNTMLSLVASGQANIAGPVYATASSVGLYVANNAIVNGHLQARNGFTSNSNAWIKGDATIDGDVRAKSNVTIDNYTSIGQDLHVLGSVNIDYDVHARNLGGTGTMSADRLEINGPGEFANGVIVGSGSDGGDLTVYGDLTVDGKFIVTGSTVNASNTFFLNDGNVVGINSRFGVARGSNANAEIRWNETAKEWSIRDVLNPSSYSKILTANLISDTYAVGNSYMLASQTAANTLNNKIINLENISTFHANVWSNALSFYANTGYAQANAANNLATSAYNKANNSTNKVWGSSGSVDSNGAIWLKSTYGLTFSGSGTDMTINTPQDFRTTGTPTLASLTLTNPLGITSGGTGASDKNSALFNLVPSTAGIPAGYVLATGGGGGSTFYWAAGGTGGGGSGTLPGTTITSSRLSYTGNLITSAYTTPDYTPGKSQLRVYLDGVRQMPSEYTETSGSMVTLNTAPGPGVKVLIEVDGYTNYPYYANNIAFTAPIGGIIQSANTIQLAIESVETRKATIASPSFTGFPLAPTAPRTTSNTQIATTAFVHALANSGVTLSHSIDGNAATVSNGVYSNGTYSNPAWITSIDSGKISGTVARATYLDGTQLDKRLTGQTNSLAMSQESTNLGSFVARATGTGDANLAGMTYWNDSYAVKLGVRADGYFGLGGWSSAAWMWYVSPGGNMTAAGNVTAYSDPRLKEGFERIQKPLDIIGKLNGGTFVWKDGYKHTEGKAGHKDYGILANEVQAVMPEIVSESVEIDGEKYLTVAYDKMVPLLIESIKELKAEIEALKGKIK